MLLYKTRPETCGSFSSSYSSVPSSSKPSRTMNKLILLCVVVACLAAVAQGAEPNRRLEVEARKEGNHEHVKASLGKQWETRDGQWSAGGYVQHSRDRFPGGRTIRDNQAGFEVRGKFKG